MPIVLVRKPKSKPEHRSGGSGRDASVVEYRTLKQVAAQLQVCTKTVRRLICENEVPVTRVGRQIRIAPEHIVLFTNREWRPN